MFGSAQKRKRDAFDLQIPVATSSNAKLRPVGKLDCELQQSVSLGKVFDSGDVLFLGSSHSGTLFKDGVFRANPVICSFDVQPCKFTDPHREVDSYEDARGNHHYFCCTKDADTMFALSGEDSRVSVVGHKLILDNPEEKITSVCCAGPVGIVGSSTHELYVIGISMASSSNADDDDDSETDGGGSTVRLFAYPLRRPRSLLQGFMESSARLLGLAWSTGREETPASQLGSDGIVKLLHVPRRRVLGAETVSDGFLIVVSDPSLCLWQLGGGTESRRFVPGDGSGGHEKFLWELDLRSALEKDLRKQVSSVIVSRGASSTKDLSKKFHIVDSLVISSSTGSRDGDKASILLLSTSTSAVSTNVELWVHGIDVDLRAGRADTSEDGEGEDTMTDVEGLCTIKIRRRVATARQSSSGVPNSCRPRLLLGSPKDGSCAYVLWGGVVGDALEGPPTLHAVELTDFRRFLGDIAADSSSLRSGESGSKHAPHHHRSNVQMTTGTDDSDAYPHYLLLHDSASRAPRDLTGASSGGLSSSMAGGVGSDTGIHCSAVVSAAVVANASGPDRGGSKDISIVLQDGAIVSCIPPSVSVTKLVTTPPSAPAPPSDPVVIMLDAANGKNTIDESFSALLTAAVHFSQDGGDSEVRGAFSVAALKVLRAASCTASKLVVDGDVWPGARSGSKISRHGGGFRGSDAVEIGASDVRDTDVSTILPAGRVLQGKLESHLRLLELIRHVMSSGEDHSDETLIPHTVLLHHHLLLGSISLCSRLKEMQQTHSHQAKKSSTTPSLRREGPERSRAVDDSGLYAAQVMEVGEKELLDIVREGMGAEVAARKSSQDGDSADGLSIGDIFFSQPTLLPSGLHSIAMVLHSRYRSGALGGGDKKDSTRSGNKARGASGLSYTPSDANKQVFPKQSGNASSSSPQFSPAHLLAASYYMVSLFLGIIQSAAPTETLQLEDQDDPLWSDLTTLSIACADEVRKAVVLALESLQFASNTCNERGVKVAEVLLRSSWEGRRVHDLGYAVLLGYEEEKHIPRSTSKPKSGQGRELNRIEDNHITKGVCANTLISLGFPEKAFDLAVRFQYFLGVMVAALDIKPDELKPQLHRLLTDSGDMEAIVDPFPRTVSLAAYCFEWLEHHGRFAELLEIGKYAPRHLKSFLKPRPYLGWFRAIEDKNYPEASQAVHKFCTGEGGEKHRSDKKAPGAPLGLATTKTMLSIGKLCSWVNMLDVVAGQTSDKIESSEPYSMESMERALLTVRAQECIVSKAKSEESAKTLSQKWNSDVPDLVSRLLNISNELMKSAQHENVDKLTPLSRALRLLLVELEEGRVSEKRRQAAREQMQKLWRASVWGDSDLWSRAAATSTGGSGTSGTVFDETQLELLLCNSMLYKLLQETQRFCNRPVPTAGEKKTEDNLDLFSLCADMILQDSDMISPAVFDQQPKSGDDRNQLKLMNDISRKQIHVVVKKCVNFASILQ